MGFQDQRSMTQREMTNMSRQDLAKRTEIGRTGKTLGRDWPTPKAFDISSYNIRIRTRDIESKARHISLSERVFRSEPLEAHISARSQEHPSVFRKFVFLLLRPATVVRRFSSSVLRSIRVSSTRSIHPIRPSG
jgi:hypothetical protein